MKYIKIVLLAIFVMFTALSCVTQRKCHKRFPPSLDTVKITTVRDSIIIKDTTIFITLPGEIVYDSVPIPCPDPGPAYIPKRVTAETSLAHAEAWWSYPNIKLVLIQKDTTIESRLQGALKEMYHWKTEYEKITVTPQAVKYVPGFYKFCTFAFLGLIIVRLGFFALKIIKIFKI